MTVNQAVEFFSTESGHSERSIVDKLQKLVDVGLGYIKLGHHMIGTFNHIHIVLYNQHRVSSVNQGIQGFH